MHGCRRHARLMLLAVLTLMLAVCSTGCARGTGPTIVTPESSETSTSAEPSADASSDAVALGSVTARLDLLVDGLDQPVLVLSDGVTPGRLYVVEKSGHVRILENGTLVDTPFLDLSRAVSDGGEQGLLGIAFSPRFAQTGRVYVNYTDFEGNTVIARFRIAVHDSLQINAASKEEILRIEQPFSNHNGGNLVFGPDGMLWIGTGDGGSAGDPLGNASNPNVLLGKMLRIDVGESDSGSVDGPYAIPADNPFLEHAGYADEVWGIGLRNPWRYSFDSVTGDLWIGDVGQNEWEEIDMIPADELPDGGDFGWDRFEGTHPYPEEGDVADLGDTVPPVVEYDHSVGRSVTGGYVYRGSRYPELDGVYVYGDFYGSIWGLRIDETGAENVLLWQGDALISSFGEDADGELLVCDLNGSVYRLAFERPE